MQLDDDQWFTRLDQKPFESHYRYFETTIDHAVEKVWPHALNIAGWMTDHRIVTLAGEPGKVGHFERVFARGIGPQVPEPHHHLYGMAALVPLKYIALEVFPERGGSYGNTREWAGFDGILLVDLGDKTKVIVLLMVVTRGKVEETKTLEEQRQDDEATRAQLESYFKNLKRLVG
jgi:hypothetical protein